MVQAFGEREAVKPPEKVLPAIRREEREHYAPIETLGRCATHLRIESEQTKAGNARAVAKADLSMRVARNVSELRLEGSTPLGSRFLNMLEKLG
jgi:hypothetical protein